MAFKAVGGITGEAAGEVTGEAKRLLTVLVGEMNVRTSGQLWFSGMRTASGKLISLRR